MKLLEKILLATDFNKSTDNVVKYVIVLAKTFQSEITLMYVLPDNIKNKKSELLLKEAAIKRLETINDRIKGEDVKTEKPILEHGNISDRIIQTAYSIKANVILIGAGEKQENDAFQLGITAREIIRKSDKPIWVIKNNSSLSIKNILCPVDFSSVSKRALKNAISLAHIFKAKLIIFSVYRINRYTPLSSKMDWDEENERKASEQIKNFNLFLADFNLKDLNWNKEIIGGDATTEIRRAITRNKSDLNIMGTSGKTGLSRFILGSVTEKVIREVPTSFITLKSEDIIDL
ncbi:MAG: universal stress protein [Flavobacteriaceae bacterium]|nr:universal stress protein [Flavobacteriaceae bacterium]